MIKFFRSIRQNLLNEGKTSKYLKYAIGEIVLVVIGILIALQINNWNTERQTKIENEAIRQSNLQEIYHDLKKDVVTLDTIISQLERQKEASKYILTIFESDDRYVSDSLKFIRNQFIASFSIAVDRNKNTWDNLNSSGQLLTLMENDLNTKLFEYYAFYDSRIKNFNELPRQKRLEFRMSTNPCDKLVIYDKNEDTTGLISVNHDKFYCYMHLEGIHESLMPIFVSSRYNIIWFNELKTQAQSIIAYMEQNIIHS